MAMRAREGQTSSFSSLLSTSTLDCSRGNVAKVTRYYQNGILSVPVIVCHNSAHFHLTPAPATQSAASSNLLLPVAPPEQLYTAGSRHQAVLTRRFEQNNTTTTFGSKDKTTITT